MKILLLGEYSGVHTNLAKALKNENYDVNVIHNGDSYKGFKPDYFLNYKYFNSKNKYINIFLKIYYVILLYSGLQGLIQIRKHLKIIRSLKNYDVVQLINPIFLADYGVIVNMIVFLLLKKNNKKIFLCALGDDFSYVTYCLKGRLKYSMFDRLTLKTFYRYLYQLHYIFGFMSVIYNYVILSKVNAIIPGLYDYYTVYKENKKCTKIVPIIVESEDNYRMASYPINVFHGWQIGKEYRKGSDIFHKVLTDLQNKYPEKINYDIVSDLPYEKYIKTFDDADLFIDQCYSQDCGVNALLGMSKGKVVCSGFEKEVQLYYGLSYMPLINVTPSYDDIYISLENLIFDLNKINTYSKNAIKFIKTFHNSNYVLSLYNEIWEEY